MRNTTTKTSLVLALTLAATSLAACAQVEADVPSAQVTQKSVAFQGMPQSQQAGEVSTTQSFTLTSDNLSWAKDLNSAVYATGVELKASDTTLDLSFIHYARITMSSGDGKTATPPVEVVNYERADNMTPTSDLTVKTTYPVDVSQVWAADKITITMNLVGVFPAQSWSADIILHMSGKISYKL